MTYLRTTALTIIALITAGVALVALPRPAGACSYLDTPLSEYADEVDIAFTGQQIGRFEPRVPVVSNDDTLLVLRVHRVFKGQTAPLITLVTVLESPSCGIDFRGRGTVAVVADEREGDLWVTLGDSRHTVDEFEEAFGPGYPPEGTFDLAGLFGDLVELYGPFRPPGDLDIASAPTEPPAVSDNTPTSDRTNPAVLLLIGAALIAFIGGTTAWHRRRRPSNNR